MDNGIFVYFSVINCIPGSTEFKTHWLSHPGASFKDMAFTEVNSNKVRLPFFLLFGRGVYSAQDSFFPLLQNFLSFPILVFSSKKGKNWKNNLNFNFKSKGGEGFEFPPLSCLNFKTTKRR